jgi:hypothetical protein
VYYVRGHRSEGTCILEDIDLSMMSEDTDLRKYVFESQGHRHNSVHKTKNRPLYLFYTDCNNSNSVTIRPSLYEIFVFSFFTDIYSTSQYFSIYVIVNFADTSMKPF